MKYYSIVKPQEKYYSSATDVLNYVASERKYLSVNGGFTVYSTKAFSEECERRGYPQYYVIDENDNAVGWCDIVAREDSPADVGFIGVGLMPEYRECGIGTILIKYVMDRAKDVGFNEVRLICRASNERALHVYKKLGFKKLSYIRSGLLIDKEKIAVVTMKKKL